MLTRVLLTVLTANSPFGTPTVTSRTSWGAKPPVQPWREHQINRITIHHAGVPTNRKRSFVDKLVGLQTFSQRVDKLASGKEKPAWPDIPYHYYIDWLGEIAECRDAKIVGDTNTEYDPTGHLLICLEGDFEREQPTAAQIRSLNRLVFYSSGRFSVAPNKVGTHRDFAKTDCPGANLYNEVSKIRARMELLHWPQ